MPGEPDMVHASQVSKLFSDRAALVDVSFSVPAGQVCALLGPNGAGKTTLFRLMTGVLKATQGSLLVDGRDAFLERVPLKRLVGYLPDEPIFYSYLSGLETLELSAAMHGLDVRATLKGLGPLIDGLRLTNVLGQYADDYSRGTKKKLALLLALLHRPRLLVLDEPTNGLDVEATHQFCRLIADEAAQGTTVLLSTHMIDQVARLCSHAIIINAGRVVATGSLAELRAAYGAELEQILLALTARPERL